MAKCMKMRDDLINTYNHILNLLQDSNLIRYVQSKQVLTPGSMHLAITPGTMRSWRRAGNFQKVWRSLASVETKYVDIIIARARLFEQRAHARLIRFPVPPDAADMTVAQLVELYDSRRCWPPVRRDPVDINPTRPLPQAYRAVAPTAAPTEWGSGDTFRENLSEFNKGSNN